MIEKLEIKDFDTVYDLMERSFPKEEYRPYPAQRALLGDPAYSIYVAREGHRIVGFAAVWELETILFLEHLAVEPDCRNGGIGTKILQYFANKRTCLEVEPPESSLTRRRIGFYERNGFLLNDYPYMQPSLGRGRNPVPLYIMTSGGTVTPEEFARVKKLLYSWVYGQTEE